MRAGSFRFRPPPVAWSGELAWVLVRAFGPTGSASGQAPRIPSTAAALATALGVAARIAARHPAERLEAELGPAGAAELARARAAAVAQGLRLELAERAALEAACGLRLEPVLLKGRALVAAGFAIPDARPAADVDLLVPAAAIAPLTAALLAAGFRATGGASYEHHASMLMHEAGAGLELHRSLPGVRLDGRRSATWEALAAASFTCAPRPGEAFRVPTREVLAAHALAHTLAQHALAGEHPGLRMIADLLDLGATDPAPAAWRPIEGWLARDVSWSELAAALDLARTLAAGLDDPRDVADRPRQLLDHFVAAATSDRYRAVLRTRLVRRPISDRPTILAAAAELTRGLVPRRGRGEPWSAYAARSLARLARVWRARLAARRD